MKACSESSASSAKSREPCLIGHLQIYCFCDSKQNGIVRKVEENPTKHVSNSVKSDEALKMARYIFEIGDLTMFKKRLS